MITVLSFIQDEIVNTYGAEVQTTICMEECSELIQAISKMKRGKDNRENLIEEMGDVYIILEQLKTIYDVTDEELQRTICKKQERQIEMLERKVR